MINFVVCCLLFSGFIGLDHLLVLLWLQFTTNTSLEDQQLKLLDPSGAMLNEWRCLVSIIIYELLVLVLLRITVSYWVVVYWPLMELCPLAFNPMFVMALCVWNLDWIKKPKLHGVLKIVDKHAYVLRVYFYPFLFLF